MGMDIGIACGMGWACCIQALAWPIKGPSNTMNMAKHASQ